jgi:hypothetical protein
MGSVLSSKRVCRTHAAKILGEIGPVLETPAQNTARWIFVNFYCVCVCVCVFARKMDPTLFLLSSEAW